MPTSVTEAFAAGGLAPQSVVRWGTRPSTDAGGVYTVSLSKRIDALDETVPEPDLNVVVFERWLHIRPELTMDGIRPPIDDLMERIRKFWFPDETILYIGMATSLDSRVGNYYATPIGRRSPHAGGYFLKLLSNIGDLWVHYTPCPGLTKKQIEKIEDDMLGSFCRGVSEASRMSLHDPAHPFPFANLVWPRGVRKLHGLRGATEPRKKAGKEQQSGD